MNFRHLSGPVALICLAIASCYPVEDPRIQQGQQQTTQLTPQQQALQAEQERLRLAEEELRQQQANLDNPNVTETPPTQNTNTQGSPGSPLIATDYPFANKVPGKEGFVFSPYSNKVIDVRDMPSGTLVADPYYLATEKKYFRVP